MSEKIFNDITNELRALNKAYPDLKMGFILQVALDEEFRRSNVDISGVSNKKILLSLERFNNNTKHKRGLGGNDNDS